MTFFQFLKISEVPELLIKQSLINYKGEKKIKLPLCNLSYEIVAFK